MKEIGPFIKKAGVALIVILGATAFAVVKFPSEGTLPAAVQVGVEGLTKEAIDQFTSAWEKMPRVSLGVPADGAKVIVVKFNDFLCPTCGYSHNLYKPVFEKFDRTNPGMVRYVLKDWPWNPKCNVAVGPGGPNHAGACEAAAAARMAHDQGHDAEVRMRDWLYSSLQQQSPPSAVKAGAESILGIKGPDFDAQYERKLPDIRQDVAMGQALRINGTPTFFINGVRFDQLMHPAYFELAIQLELNKK